MIYDDQAVLVLLKLFKYPDLVELALSKAETETETQALVEAILTQILIHGQVNVADQRHRMDEICELCETALPYATRGGLLYSEFLLKEVGNWQGVSPSIWNHRVKALFGTQDLGALAKIVDSDLELAYANWKTQMQSTDHNDAMVSIHIAASLCRLGYDQNLFATSSSSSQDREPIDLPPILFKWILRARELFVLPKGPKIIKVTFIRTVKAVVDALSDRSPFLLEMTTMAREILRVVDVPSLNEWDQESATAVQKLTEKLLEPGIPPALMANAFCVLLMGNTSRKCRVPTRFIILFQPVVKALLLQSSHFSPNEINSPWEFITALVELLPLASEESVSREVVSQCLQEVLTAIFELCRPAKLEVRNRLGIAWASLLLNALEKRMSKATDGQEFLADVFCDVVRELGFPRWWTINLSKSEKPRNCARMRCCPHLAEFSRQQLCKGLSRIFVELSSRDEATENCSDIIKLLAQAQSQMDMATSESTWSVCQFDQVPAHLEALRKGEEKCSELTRVLKSTETHLAELEQSHQIVKANYSCARERQAYLLQRSQDLSTTLQDLRLERGQLHEQLSTALTAMESEREESARQMEQIAWDAQQEVQDYELAYRGAELLRQEEAEVQRSVKEDLQTQVQWLREQHDIKDKEFKDAHDKEIKVMQDQFVGQRIAMDEKVGTQATPPPGGLSDVNISLAPCVPRSPRCQ